MSELNLKSPKKNPKRLAMVRCTKDMQFFGINGSQISATMSGIHLEWNGEVVVVTSDNSKGEERWIFPASISDMKWVDSE